MASRGRLWLSKGVIAEWIQYETSGLRFDEAPVPSQRDLDAFRLLRARYKDEEDAYANKGEGVIRPSSMG